MAVEVEVFEAEWKTFEPRLFAIRHKVFVEEQSVPPDLEWDGEDPECRHFIAVNSLGQDLGCARLAPDGRIGRMAVHASARGLGIGRRLLDLAIETAIEAGLRKVTLHAQTHALTFYRNAGFLPVGGTYDEAGIEHQSMELALPIPFVRSDTKHRARIDPQPAPETPSDALVLFKGVADAQAACLHCVKQPRRVLHIYSQELDHQLFDNDVLVDAVSEFARGAPAAECRILIHASSALIARTHRLVELAQRLPSKVEIRKIAEEFTQELRSYLYWDRTGYLLLPDYRAYAGSYRDYDPVTVARMDERFSYLWERAEPDPELRRLQL